jgi:hypothetical protein
VTDKTRLTYYNGFLWRTTMLPDGKRTVQLLRTDDNRPAVARAEIRYPSEPRTT